MRSLTVLAAVGAMLLSVVPPVAAQTQKPLEFTVTVTGKAGVVKGSPSDHFLSFSGPIEIPGVGLKPGTYIFQQLADNSVVRVISSDRSKVYATFFTTPVSRYTTYQGAVEPMVTFERTGPNAPARIAAWFLPGQMNGVAPMYPQARASAASGLAD